MIGKIYNFPPNYFFYKPYAQIHLSKLRNRIIIEYNNKVSYQKKLDNFVKMHTVPRTIFEWTPYSSSSSSSSSTSSYVSIESTLSETWVDMKKLL